MRSALLPLFGMLALATSTVRANETVDAACHERLSSQVVALESGYEANRKNFDTQLDQLLTSYATAHPEASREDYRGVVDQVWAARFGPMFEVYDNLLLGYKAVLDGTGELRGICSVSEKEMARATDNTIERQRGLYEDILSEMSRMFAL